ncbi:YihA family ribosome biogenesis GTP-binding protein [Stappia taiwanensis]|uniref:Probable GTP-binding protein EngB n=1 Tax=Stappia taiwanensis TaxID=992267 RepID=A0A838Y0H6_9HYPH|nr:ribosome biogenesis GTP-binding protein YihA/YsxC [Stappia taiwanensis]MBA4612744.1 YihA family ribosome biogenesis GTP-binding protein [Stappia taiwanensis]GGE90391.1 putative GTP-binding protein EngB [Stappia taiwanensis]
MTETSETDRQKAEQIEAGRLLFRRPWGFVTSVAQLEQLPPDDLVEVAFAGRSNVGKSSLINAITGVKGLARTSNTPGRTQMLNYFGAPESPVALVDMPGYGYAQAPKSLVDAWTDLVFSYLRGRARLRRVFVLIDSRHGIKDNDTEVMGLLDRAAVNYQIVLTKIDKIKVPQAARMREATLEKIAKRPAAHPFVIETSSEKGIGIAEIRAEINTIGTM